MELMNKHVLRVMLSVVVVFCVAVLVAKLVEAGSDHDSYMYTNATEQHLLMFADKDAFGYVLLGFMALGLFAGVVDVFLSKRLLKS